MPIERKQDVAHSLMQGNMLGKVNLVNKDIYAHRQTQVQVTNQAPSQNPRSSFIIGQDEIPK